MTQIHEICADPEASALKRMAAIAGVQHEFNLI